MLNQGRVNKILAQTWRPEVARTYALEQDLLFLYQDKNKFQNPKLNRQIEFVEHIRRVSKDKPHVLLAYGHVLYLALFAGGRSTRAKILAQNELFSDLAQGVASDSARNNIAYNATNFLHFQVEDELSLRAEFKSTYELATRNELTEQEKQEIIDESIEIFQRLLQCLKEIEQTNLQSQRARKQKDRYYGVAIYLMVLLTCLVYFVYRAEY
jgi:heme oxygenase